jgi:hypothetical protein
MLPVQLFNTIEKKQYRCQLTDNIVGLQETLAWRNKYENSSAKPWVFFLKSAFCPIHLSRFTDNLFDADLLSERVCIHLDANHLLVL